MGLNSKGKAPFSLLVAVIAVGICYLLTVFRSNDYADIPVMKASKNAVADSEESVRIKAGEEFSILGSKWMRSDRDGKDQLMLLAQNSVGERAFFNPDLISEEQLREIMPILGKKSYDDAPAFFNRKTITKEMFDSIPSGLSIAQIDSIFVPARKIVTEDGFQVAKYQRMDVFDKKTGMFYVPSMRFKDGKYCGNDLTEIRKKHMNAWLLRILPGTNFVYGHNVFNPMFQKKAFGKLHEDPIEIKGFFGKLMGIAIFFFIAIAILVFYAFVPAIPAYVFYGLLLFPPLFKPFNRTLTSIMVVVLTVLGCYYCWLAFMPYLSFFLMPLLFVPAAIFAVNPLFDDDICEKCRYMNTVSTGVTEQIGEYDSERIETEETIEDSVLTDTGKAWDEVTRTINGVKHVSNENVRYYKVFEDTCRIDKFNCRYRVKKYRNYCKCGVCGRVISYKDSEVPKLVSKEYLDSDTVTKTRKVWD